MRKRRADPRIRAVGWGYGPSVLFTVVGCWLYLFGLIHLVRFESDYYTCTNWRYGYFDGPEVSPLVEFEDGLFPLRAVCYWADGYSLDHVPSYVNPGLVLCIAAAVIAAVIEAFRGRSAAARANGESGEPDHPQGSTRSS